MIGLTRLYCNRERDFLIDVDSEEASKRAEELLNDGWEIEAAIPIDIEALVRADWKGVVDRLSFNWEGDCS